MLTLFNTAFIAQASGTQQVQPPLITNIFVIDTETIPGGSYPILNGYDTNNFGLTNIYAF